MVFAYVRLGAELRQLPTSRNFVAAVEPIANKRIISPAIFLPIFLSAKVKPDF